MCKAKYPYVFMKDGVSIRLKGGIHRFDANSYRYLALLPLTYK